MTNESGEFESLIDDVDGYFVFKISKDSYKGLKFNLTPTNIRRGEDTHMGKCKLVVSSSSESEETIENNFKVANTFLYVGDKYIYSNKSTIYLKKYPTDKATVLASFSQNGHDNIESIMSDGHVLYCAASTGTSPDNCVIYSYNLDSKVLKNLFVTKRKFSFVTCYNNFVYYLDNNTLNKYDLSSGKNIVVVDNVKLGIINSTCINSKMYFQIASTVNDEGDVLEFDFNTEKSKVILNNSSIIDKYRVADDDKVYFKTESDNDWYISSVDKNGILKKSAKIPSKLTLSQGVISSDGSFALMMNKKDESDFDLYKFELDTGNITVIKDGAGGFKNKGSGLGYDLKNTEDIYLIGAGNSIAKFNGNGYDKLKVDGNYDPYVSWVADGYVINREFNWCKIN